MLTDAHPVTSHELLGSVIDYQSEREEDEPYHKQGPVVNASTNDLAHFLRDNSRHRVHWLEKSAEALSEIRNRDPVSGTEQDYHRLAYDTTEAQQHR